MRRNEAAGLKRTDVDFENGVLRLGDTKTGFSSRPMAKQALELLKSLPRERESPYFFPAERGGGYYQGTKRIWQKVIGMAGLTGITPHTLRHTVASTAVSSGESLP
jgi:integrase